jgi:bacterioferritin
MQGAPVVLKELNAALTSQLTSINQLFLHARMMEKWGFARIGKRLYKQSICAMKFAESLTDRILLLEGLPNYQKLLKLKIGEAAVECLENERNSCLERIGELSSSIATCLQNTDHVSRQFLEQILISEQDLLDWLEAQKQLIEDLGETLYLSEQIGTNDD